MVIRSSLLTLRWFDNMHNTSNNFFHRCLDDIFGMPSADNFGVSSSEFQKYSIPEKDVLIGKCDAYAHCRAQQTGFESE